MMQTNIDAKNILLPSYRGRLLEGIKYNRANNTLLWVDIISAEIHRVCLDNEADLEASHEVLKFAEAGESIGAVLLTKDPDIVLACAKYGVATASFKTKQFAYMVKYPLCAESAASLRSNDGLIDPWGNIWIGLMNDFPTVKAQGKVEPAGVLYRISAADLSVKTMVKDAYIPNGLAFSNDGNSLFWTDSLTFTVWQFDYDHEHVTLKNKRPLLAIQPVYPGVSSPEPDGLSCTSQGDFYHAIFSTSSVLKYDSRGEVQQKLMVPAELVTCTGLGGAADDELYITTGHQNLLDSGAEIDALDKTGDLGGFLFRVKLGHKAHSQPAAVWGGQI
ncbi:Gluconolactonase putatively [Metschnikowia bicuspidata var. bicuspidata NRRL YB-4993]|uniref:Gluconolactonase putatively n=1 Tax=Metschnikowia bicuspidata var. bicuspidata NRRL YB-4993 TaxID=869754 RepID=A0A1A0HK50_9ASCO|nr:Gluconolactonase putatively [Metschnikowia bicuspidata var. bicuspidata NRRL YB-4993]OBA24178.1 Gluconolactonase putatively [Metschnikowia bicuspidata var. bicuspidata NRRL YB-4993]